MSVLPLVILVVAGIALVVQNTLMARITGQMSSVIITLVLNSSVGLVLLTALLWGKSGLSGFAEIASAFRWWFLLPGILGAYFVFANIWGYQKLGAASTISILVASQLIAGLAFDIYRRSGEAGVNWLPAGCGVVLLIAGAYLVAANRP